MQLDQPLPRSWAIAVALLVAIVSGWIAAHIGTSFVTDMDQVWFATRALMDGKDPYALIGPDHALADGSAFRFAFYYPPVAPFLLLPLAPFPVEVTRVAMAAVPGGLLAYLVARWRPFLLLPLFLSRAYYLNVWYVQWTVIATTALFLPWLGGVLAAKPNIGVAMLAGYQSRRDLVRCSLSLLVVVVATFMLYPDWLPRWFVALREGEHLRPFVLLPGGAILLLAALRWRSWRARLLLALSLVPQTMTAIGALPLLLLPHRWQTAAALSLCSFLPSLLITRAPFNQWVTDSIARGDFTATTHVVGLLTLWTVYLPGLVIVLWEHQPTTDPGIAHQASTLETGTR